MTTNLPTAFRGALIRLTVVEDEATETDAPNNELLESVYEYMKFPLEL